MEKLPPKNKIIGRPTPGNNRNTSSCSSWSISEDSLRRYVYFASESCIQELLTASVSDHNITNPTHHTKNGGGIATRTGNVDDDEDGWKLLMTLHNGVEVSKRRSSGSHHVFRSRWHLPSISPQQFSTVANAIDAAKQWDSDLVEGRYIKDLEKNLSIVRLRYGENSKLAFRKREFIVYERRETMSDGTLVVAVASLPKEIATGLQPNQHNSIRELLLQSGWVVEKQPEDDSSCVVTYVVQLDPAGWLPKYFANRLGTKLVIERIMWRMNFSVLYYATKGCICRLYRSCYHLNMGNINLQRNRILTHNDYLITY